MQEFPVVWLESIVLASSVFSKPLLPWLLFPFFPAFEAPRDLSSSILHFILRSHTNGGVLFFNPSLLTAYSQKKEMVMSQGQVVQAQLAFVHKSLRKSSFLPMRELHCTVPTPCAPHHTVDRHENSYLLVFHVARVRHLLGINTKQLALGRVHSYDAVVHHVLQVGEAAPYVVQLVVRVVTGPREPNPWGKQTL